MAGAAGSPGPVSGLAARTWGCPLGRGSRDLGASARHLSCPRGLGLASQGPVRGGHVCLCTEALQLGGRDICPDPGWLGVFGVLHLPLPSCWAVSSGLTSWAAAWEGRPLRPGFVSAWAEHDCGQTRTLLTLHAHQGALPGHVRAACRYREALLSRATECHAAGEQVAPQKAASSPPRPTGGAHQPSWGYAHSGDGVAETRRSPQVTGRPRGRICPPAPCSGCVLSQPSGGKCWHVGKVAANRPSTSGGTSWGDSSPLQSTWPCKGPSPPCRGRQGRSADGGSRQGRGPRARACLGGGVCSPLPQAGLSVRLKDGPAGSPRARGFRASVAGNRVCCWQTPGPVAVGPCSSWL